MPPSRRLATSRLGPFRVASLEFRDALVWVEVNASRHVASLPLPTHLPTFHIRQRETVSEM